MKEDKLTESNSLVQQPAPVAALCGGIMESCCLQKVQTQLKNYISELSKYEAWNLVMLGALIDIKEIQRKGIQNVTYVERYIYINIWLEKT